jgi:hypothetical protein
MSLVNLNVERRIRNNAIRQEKRAPRTGTMFVDSQGATKEASVVEHFCDICERRIAKFTFFKDGSKWEEGETLYTGAGGSGRFHRGCIPRGASISDRIPGN